MTTGRTQTTDLTMHPTTTLRIPIVAVSGILPDGALVYDERNQTLALGTMTGNQYFVSQEKFDALEMRVKQLETN